MKCCICRTCGHRVELECIEVCELKPVHNCIIDYEQTSCSNHIKGSGKKYAKKKKCNNL